MAQPSNAMSMHAWAPPRALMPLPAASFADLLAPALDACNALLPSMPPRRTVFARLRQAGFHATAHRCNALRHELSKHIVAAPIDFSWLLALDEGEAQSYDEWRATIGREVHLNDLVRGNTVATNGAGRLRASHAYLRAQGGDIAVPTVHWREARKRLSELPKILNAGEFGQGLLPGVVLLALVNNAHAFTDGNGRLARFLFNFCLHHEGMPSTSFVPLRTLAVLSGGGYEIRLREAELFGEWTGLLSYHCQAVQLLRAWGELDKSGREALRNCDV